MVLPACSGCITSCSTRLALLTTNHASCVFVKLIVAEALFHITTKPITVLNALVDFSHNSNKLNALAGLANIIVVYCRYWT